MENELKNSNNLGQEAEATSYKPSENIIQGK